MLIAANFTIMAISLWVKSGQSLATQKPKEKASTTSVEATQAGRDLFVPLGVVAVCQGLAAVPLYIFNHLPAGVSAPQYHHL
jgi:glycosylphosphatidylinositol transamidase